MRSISGRSRVIHSLETSLEKAIARRSPAPIQPSIPPSTNWVADPGRTPFDRHLVGDPVSVDTIDNDLAVYPQFAAPALPACADRGARPR
jgi:hypothetical protein